MSPEVAGALLGLLETVAPRELDELIEALKYYNRRCKESDRADCARYGCSTKEDPDLEARVKDACSKIPDELRKSLLEKRGSQQVYMLTKKPVCRCCGR